MTLTEYYSSKTMAELRTILARMNITRGLSAMRKAELVDTVITAVEFDHTQALAENATTVRVPEVRFMGMNDRVKAYHTQNGGKVLTRRQMQRAKKKFSKALGRGLSIQAAMEGC